MNVVCQCGVCAICAPQTQGAGPVPLPQQPLPGTPVGAPPATIDPAIAIVGGQPLRPGPIEEDPVGYGAEDVLPAHLGNAVGAPPTPDLIGDIPRGNEVGAPPTPDLTAPAGADPRPPALQPYIPTPNWPTL